MKFFFLLFVVLLFSAEAITKNEAVLVSKDSNQSYTKPWKYKSMLQWRKGIYVSGNVDDYNPEMIPGFSQEIVEGIRSSRKNEKSANKRFWQNENESFDKGSPYPTSSS